MRAQLLSRRIIPGLVLIALASLAHAADLPALHAALFKRAMAAPRVAASPADSVAFFLSGWMLTGDETCLKAAQEQLTRSHGHINRDGLYEEGLVDGSNIVRMLATADHLLAYWIACQLLEDRKMRVHLDRCVEGMVQSLARQPVRATNGQVYTLFAPMYDAPKPYEVAVAADIAPQCSAALGLVFTLLYHDEKSKWFHDETIKDIALNELHASMATQRLQSGAILPDGSATEAQADPAVGAAVLFAWSWANRFWQEPDTEIRIRRAVDWLDPYFDGRAMTPQAMWQVFAAFADHGRDLHRLMGLYEVSLADVRSTPACGQAYLYLMGLPADLLRLTGLSGKWLPVPPAVHQGQP